MSCYLRHVKDIIAEVGIAITPENRKQVDEAIHQAVGVAYKNCPATWKKIKDEIRTDEEKRGALVKQLQSAIH